jgi:outer membrane protein assembly factor BamB
LGIGLFAFMQVGGLEWLGGWFGEQNLVDELTPKTPTPRLLAQGPAVLVNGSQQDPASIFSIIYDVSVSGRKLALIESPGSIRWMNDLGGDSYIVRLGVHGELAYFANGATLQAFQLNDGTRIWTTQLSDDIINTTQSLVVLGGRVIALTTDRTLQAYDAATGRPAWVRRLSSSSREIRLAGERLLILDRFPGETFDSVVLLNPANGTEELVIKPQCFRDQTSGASLFGYNLSSEDGIVYNPSDQRLYLIFGSSFGCAQRFNLTNGMMEWETKEPGGFTTAFSKFNPLPGAERLYFGYDHNLAALDYETGKLTMLLDDPDYRFVPLALLEDRLVVRAMSQRGSRKFELWAIESASGRRLWQTGFGEFKPLDPPDEMAGVVSKAGCAFTYAVDEGELLLIKFTADPNQLVIESLDLARGVIQTRAELPLTTTASTSYVLPTPLGIHDSAFWVLVDNRLLVIDLITGELIFRWQ